jgi:hypothetical protein
MIEPGTRVKWHEEARSWVYGVVEGQDPVNTAHLLVRVGRNVWSVNNCLLRTEGKEDAGTA